MGNPTSRIRKLKALESFIRAETGVGPVDFIKSKFQGKSFTGSSVDKGHLFVALCAESQGGLSVAEVQFINDRLGTGKLKFYSGGRAPAEYAFDLMAGWIVEDLLKARLQNLGAKVDSVGDDKEREFLIAPSAEADWNIDGVLAECFVDFLGTWERQGYMDVKPGKMDRLSKGQMVMYCFDLQKDFFTKVDVGDILRVCGGKVPPPVVNPIWKKETYHIPWKPESFQQIVKTQ